MEFDSAATLDLVRLGRGIRRVRLAAGYTQEALALAAGLDRSYVGSVERGERNISFLNLLLLARALNTEVASFLIELNRERPESK